jgi:hypothetical protein
MIDKNYTCKYDDGSLLFIIIISMITILVIIRYVIDLPDKSTEHNLNLQQCIKTLE